LDDLAHFPSGFYEAVVAKDVLEHITRASSLDVLLSFNEWMRIGGELYIQTTSVLGVADRIRKYPSFDHDFGMTICLFGNQAHPGDFHLTGFTERTLVAHLRAAGFEPGPITLVDEWMFAVTAKKVQSWSDVVDASSDDAFVASLFQTALGRAPSASELASRLGELRSDGKARKQVAREVFVSHERLRFCAP
jgi:hypothetical protein